MNCLVRSPPMIVRAARPTEAAMSRKSSATAAPERICETGDSAAASSAPPVRKMPSFEATLTIVQPRFATRLRRRIGLQIEKGQASLTCLYSIARARNVRFETERLTREGDDAMHIRPVVWRGCFLALTLIAALAAPVSAQVDTGTISGVIKDESGGVLPGATVTITHEGQGLTLTTV